MVPYMVGAYGSEKDPFQGLLTRTLNAFQNSVENTVYQKVRAKVQDYLVKRANPRRICHTTLAGADFFNEKSGLNISTGEWWNGIHEGLKILWPKGLEGSIPSLPIKFFLWLWVVQSILLKKLFRIKAAEPALFART